MAGNTTNFNIAYPTSTDYVKDGATAIQTVATGFDTRLGDVTNYPQQIVNVVSSVSRPIAYAMSTGRFNVSGTSVAVGASVNVTVAFTRSTRFNDTPLMFLTQTNLPGGSASLIVKCTGVSGTGFTAYVYNVGTAAATFSSMQVDFLAVQMTRNSSENS
jgi:hypothetical protein